VGEEPVARQVLALEQRAAGHLPASETVELAAAAPQKPPVPPSAAPIELAAASMPPHPTPASPGRALDQVIAAGMPDAAGYAPTLPPADAAEPAVPARPPAPAKSAVSADHKRKRADIQARAGNISAARLLYAEAAQAGDGKAAEALARTYDPQVQGKHGTGGPDLLRALEWYLKAMQEGDSAPAARVLQIEIAQPHLAHLVSLSR
jgi:hypothetical protein